MQRHRYDERAFEFVTLKTLLEDVAHRSGHRNAVGVLQVVDNLAERMCEQHGRSGEIEHVLASKTETAQAFDRRRGFTAFLAKGRLDRKKAGPAFRTCPSPPAL